MKDVDLKRGARLPSEDSIINRIKELSKMGFTHAIFNMPDLYKITPLETFAQEVIPATAEL